MVIAAHSEDNPTETEHQLLDLARGRTRPIPAEILVRHIIRVTPDAGWRVRREAMEALLRRMRSVSGDQLVDDGRGHLGPRQIRRKGRRNSARPYSTQLLAVDPPDGRCDCPDFLKSSLGLCKHLLATLAFVYDKPGRLARARDEQRALGPPASRLRWDPVRPLLGLGDWVAQVRLEVGAKRSAWADALAPAFQNLDDLVADQDRRREFVGALDRTLQSAAYKRCDPFPDPALLELVAAELDRATRTRPPADDEFDRALDTLALDLYPYQVESVRHCLTNTRLLLADDMGLGKTAQAIAAVHALFACGRVSRGLVIVPASLKRQWEREWHRFTSVPVRVVDGSPDERTDLYRTAKDGVLILNYELVLRDLDQLLDLGPDIVVLDEAQRIRNWATKTSKAIKRFEPAYRLVLTGTPMQNRLEELASIMEWVDERALEPRWRLVPWHTEHAGDGASGFAGARNLDTLRTRLAGSMIRRSRTEVLSQLPARTDTTVPVEMTDRQLEEHGLLDLPIRGLLAKRRKRPLTHEEFLRLMRLFNTQRMISNAVAQVEFEEIWPSLDRRRPTRSALDSLYGPKLIELRELVQNVVVEQGRKVVIFSEWRRMLRLAGWALRDILDANGLRAVYFTGAESQKLRDRSVVELADDPATRVMFLSDAGGVGLNLQRSASCCINLELPWNPAVLEQRIARIYRLGQSEPVDVYNLICTSGIETRIEQIVRGKQQLFDAVFDGTTDEVRFEEHHSFLERMEHEPPPAPHEEDEDEDEAPDETSRALHLMDSADDRSNPPAAPTAPLFDRVRMERTEDGGLRIEAPPDVARDLASLFEGVARLFRTAAEP